MNKWRIVKKVPEKRDRLICGINHCENNEFILYGIKIKGKKYMYYQCSLCYAIWRKKL